MKLEDYNEYYIQGSDHYLIPKAAFIELYEEMNNFRKESRENKEVIDKIKRICSSVPYTWSVCGIDVVHKIEKVLKEVE